MARRPFRNDGASKTRSPASAAYQPSMSSAPVPTTHTPGGIPFVSPSFNTQKTASVTSISSLDAFSSSFFGSSSPTASINAATAGSCVDFDNVVNKSAALSIRASSSPLNRSSKASRSSPSPKSRSSSLKFPSVEISTFEAASLDFGGLRFLLRSAGGSAALSGAGAAVPPPGGGGDRGVVSTSVDVVTAFCDAFSAAAAAAAARRQACSSIVRQPFAGALLVVPSTPAAFRRTPRRLGGRGRGREACFGTEGMPLFLSERSSRRKDARKDARRRAAYRGRCAPTCPWWG